MTVPADLTEHRVPRDGGSLYVRDHAGAGPAFVLLHGFPDNAHIYDDLIPHLTAAGRRIVTVDFLGFGASDKPKGAIYSFPQQLADVQAVVDALELDRVIPVGHDAGGPAAVNFALRHPDRTAAVVLMNAFYGAAPGQLVPELIELFSYKPLQSLAHHFLASPEQFAWPIKFQRQQLLGDAAAAGRPRYDVFLGPLIDENFRQQPSAIPAFVQMTSQLNDEIAANTGRLVEMRRLQVPFALIWAATTRTFMCLRRSSCARRCAAACCTPWMPATGRRSMPPRKRQGSCLRSASEAGHGR